MNRMRKEKSESRREELLANAKGDIAVWNSRFAGKVPFFIRGDNGELEVTFEIDLREAELCLGSPQELGRIQATVRTSFAIDSSRKSKLAKILHPDALGIPAELEESYALERKLKEEIFKIRNI